MRQFCTDTAFSMAEPAGDVCPSVEVLKPRSQLSVCRGPETQIPTNILIHLSSNIFCFGDLLEPILKKWRFLLLFLALKMWSLCHFFFHKNHLYESYLIFCHKVAEKFTPKKKKKTVV